MKNNSMTEVVFKVGSYCINNSTFPKKYQAYASVQFGEEIRVSGNVPALGCDNPDRAIPMFTSPSEFPWWHTKEGLLYFFII
jgi:hypothetical protein